MFQVLAHKICPTPMRIGWMTVKYYGLVFRCNIMVYKREKIFIRMPEVFLQGVKYPFAAWSNKKDSDAFQNQMLKYLMEKEALNLEKAVFLKLQGHRKKKKLDKNKKTI